MRQSLSLGTSEWTNTSIIGIIQHTRCSMKCICHGIKFSLTLLAVFWLIAGNAVASNSQSIQTIASVSFTTVDSVDFLGTVIGIPLISAEVNGHSAQLVFDTGTSYNFVTDDFAKRIGLIDDKSSNVIVDATGSKIDAKTYDLVPIEVGSYTIKSNILSARDEISQHLLVLIATASWEK